jgi:hypothetical protein
MTQHSWTNSLLPRKSAPKKKCFLFHLSARLSGPLDPPLFLSQHNHWSSALKSSICWWIGYIGLLDPYLQHVISTFNTCSWGPTHLSLTDIDGGYNVGGVGFSHHTPYPSQSTVLHFSPKGSVQSPITMFHKKLSRFKIMETYCRYVVFRPHDHLPLPTSIPSQSYRLNSSHRINKEGTKSNPNASRHQSNSYNLMYKQDS